MDVRKAKAILSKHAGKNVICDLFMKQQGITKSRTNVLWGNYLEFMLVKIYGFDVGTGNRMKFSTSKEMDDLWHCHVLCTEHYQDFMELVKEVNPLVEFIHHSMLLELSPEEEKLKRREATAAAYRKLFGTDCLWLTVQKSSPGKEITSYFSPKSIRKKRKLQQVEQIDFEISLPSKERLKMSVLSSCTMKAVRSTIANHMGSSTNSFRLIFNYQRLPDDGNLSDWGITTGSLVEMYHELSGC